MVLLVTAMKSLCVFLYALLFSVYSGATSHDHYDGLQMPVGYVRYPYQAMYPGDGEGILLFASNANRLHSF